LGALLGGVIEAGEIVDAARRTVKRLSLTQRQVIQTEKTRALASIAAGIAHEFNNLLAIIIAKTELVRDRVANGGVRNDLAFIGDTAWRAADTVRRLLAFASRGAQDMATVDLNTIAADVVTATQPLWKEGAEARGVRIEVMTDFTDVANVYGVTPDLREAVMNLMLNAIDAMPRGGRITIRTRKYGRTVSLSIIDTGEGMSREVQDRMFEPFFTTRSPERIGLGLSEVQGIVARHHGQIDAQSEVGRGTSMTLVLPEAPESRDESATT
jgi:signal transduction histidine kinase